MDVQGGRFHLLSGRSDWTSCSHAPPGAVVRPLGFWWDSADPRSNRATLEWSESEGVIRLQSVVPTFVLRGSRAVLRGRPERRGAGAECGGCWYWIGQDCRSIWRRLPGTSTPAVMWWSLDEGVGGPGDVFAECTRPEPLVGCLQGLTVSGASDLVVGVVRPGEEQGGLLVFDLECGGLPETVTWLSTGREGSPGPPVRPLDLAAADDGSVLVLDEDGRRWWRLDRCGRLPAVGIASEVVSDRFVDQTRLGGEPVDPAAQVDADGGGSAHEWRWTAPPFMVPGDSRADAVEAGPGGLALFLGGPLDDAAEPASTVWIVPASGEPTPWPLVVPVADPEQPNDRQTEFGFVATDLCVIDDQVPSCGVKGGGNGCGRAGWRGNHDDHDHKDRKDLPLVFVGGADIDQAIAFRLRSDAKTPSLEPVPRYYSLRGWRGRGIVAHDGDVWADMGPRAASVDDTVDCWLPLESYDACAFAPEGAFVSPTAFSATPGAHPPLLGQPFDGETPGCVWHRVFLDARIPVGTSVTVEARAFDDPDGLDKLPWIIQPSLYLRSGGCELPYYEPWASLEDEVQDDRTGTWELLFQGIVGRYVQLRITLRGSVGQSPKVRSVRAWYPRFSYVTNYLPAIFGATDDDRFLERFLANVEGVETVLEERMERVGMLFDPYATPRESVDWLASWVGLALESAWDEPRRRFLVAHVDDFFRRRGTLGGLRAVLRLYLRCWPGGADGDRAVIDATVVFDPTARSDDPAFLVELFMNRPQRADEILALAGGADPDGDNRAAAERQAADELAHRLLVLVPAALSPEVDGMVERIVDMLRPAHVAFELRRAAGLLRVGDVTIGDGTVVGPSHDYTPMVEGVTVLGGGSLATVDCSPGLDGVLR